jgi:hypothetical protein
MTVINQAELAELTKLDQVLLWCIVSINASNLDPRNNNISDNAAIRAESRDYITWQVQQDDKGKGQFTFTALLPIVNPHPLQDKVSLLSRVWSYSPFDPNMETEAGIDGYGEDMPTVPIWVDTVEKLLAFVAIRATKISKLVPLISGEKLLMDILKDSYWGKCQYQITDSAYGSQMSITGYLTINWRTYIHGGSLIRCLNPPQSGFNHLNCNFPKLADLWSVSSVDLDLPVEDLIPLIPIGTYGLSPNGELREIAGIENGAQSLINSYSQNYFIDDALPDWYADIINNQPHLQTFTTGIGSVSSPDSKAPKLVESLPICKEQDPTVVSYGRTPLANILAK